MLACSHPREIEHPPVDQADVAHRLMCDTGEEPEDQATSSVTDPSSSRPWARYWPIFSSSGASDTE